MKILLKAKHFKDSKFIGDNNPIVRAVKEQTGYPIVHEGIWNVTVGELEDNLTSYYHDDFSVVEHVFFKDEARNRNFDDTVLYSINVSGLSKLNYL